MSQEPRYRRGSIISKGLSRCTDPREYNRPVFGSRVSATCGLFLLVISLGGSVPFDRRDAPSVIVPALSLILRKSPLRLLREFRAFTAGVSTTRGVQAA